MTGVNLGNGLRAWLVAALMLCAVMPAWSQEPEPPPPPPTEESPTPAEETQPPSDEPQTSPPDQASEPPADATQNDPPGEETLPAEGDPQQPSEPTGADTRPSESDSATEASPQTGGEEAEESTSNPAEQTSSDPTPTEEQSQASDDVLPQQPVEGNPSENAAEQPSTGDLPTDNQPTIAPSDNPSTATESDPSSERPDTEQPDDMAGDQPTDIQNPESPPTETPVLDDAPAVSLPNVPTDYRITVALDPDAKTLTGELTLMYTNHSDDFIGDLRFHLYLNAFKNNRSVFMREQGGNRRSGDDWWGYQTVTSVSVNGIDRTAAMTYAPSADGTVGDQTVLIVPLTDPLLPGQPVEVSLTFEAKLPRVQARTGYYRDYFLVAQWFPKIGVWQPSGMAGREKGGWFCPPFHRNTEFFADFGNYDVSIQVPKHFEVGATGNQIATEESDDIKRLTFRAERVHDFAWTASPRFVRIERVFNPSDAVTAEEMAEVMDLHGVPLAEAQLKPVNVTLLMQPEHAGQADRHFEAIATGLKYFGLWYGPYPYDSLTVVDPAFGARDSAGMEYPTFITIGTYFLRSKRDLDLEYLILHEFAHQYWYGMVASNEVTEPWLDEGITTYTSARLLDRVYGKSHTYSDVLSGLPFQSYLGMRDPSRSTYHTHFRVPVTRWLGVAPYGKLDWLAYTARQEGGLEPIVRPGYLYRNRSAYYHNAYTKPATALAMLERELGEPTMARAMRAYFRRWQFAHPTTADFIAAVNEAAGRDMQPFFDTLFYNAGTLDAGVKISYEVYDPEAGYVDTEEGTKLSSAGGVAITSKVTVTHYGSARLPVDILVTFDDGSQKREQWAGNEPWVTFRYPDRTVSAALLDPDNKLLLDANRFNDSHRPTSQATASRRFSERVLSTAQHLLQFLAGGWL